MAFDIGFGIFVLLMVVLAGFVIRFSIQLNKDEQKRRRRPAGLRAGPSRASDGTRPADPSRRD